MNTFLGTAIRNLRSHPVLGTATLLLALGAAAWWIFPYADRAKDFLLHRNDPNYARCRDEKIADACVGLCMDGFGSTLYYDRGRYDLDSLRPAMFFEDSVLERGIGLKYVSVCHPCERVYRIGMRKVDCHEFYRVIDSASGRTRIGTIEAGI